MSAERLAEGVRRDADDGSFLVDQRIVDAFTDDPDNPFLVSFPRTGSHWLRMLMELYFERPSLVRVFYYPERDDYLTLHVHDVKLDVVRRDVLYLYRDPVDTIFSQLNYHQADLADDEPLRHWAGVYGRHLDKWLVGDDFTQKKTVLTYEGMRADLPAEFAKVTAHFGQELDEAKLAAASVRVTKGEVKKKTPHDPQVVQLAGDYENVREWYRAERGPRVWELLTEGRPGVAGLFEGASS